MHILVNVALICVLLLVPNSKSWSKEPAIELGREQAIRALICDSEEKAKAVIDTHASKGFEEARTLAGSTCLTAQFIGTPVLVADAVPLGELTLKVIRLAVRMQDNSTTTWWMPTWLDVAKGKEA